MLIPATDNDFAALIAGHPVRGHTLPHGGIENPEILTMLRGLAAKIPFTPNAWLMAEAGEIAGLCSLTTAPENGILTIGYGVAPARRQRGIARRAIADLVAWARTDPRVIAITAATSPENRASQHVLTANGFAPAGERIDPEDGPLRLWHHALAATACKV